jgi:hypothetical protein
MQTKEGLTPLCEAVAEGTCGVKGKRLYAPDGTWIYIGLNVSHLKIHGVSADVYFPDLLKLREKLVLLQLGWGQAMKVIRMVCPTCRLHNPGRVCLGGLARYGEIYI